MASSFRDAFSKASIVQANLPQMTAQVAAVQVQSAPMALPDAQAPQPINAEPWAGNPAVPQWCAVLSEVIPTKTLIAALDHATCEGTGAARAAFEARVEGAIAQLTKRQGDELRAIHRSRGERAEARVHLRAIERPEPTRLRNER